MSQIRFHDLLKANLSTLVLILSIGFAGVLGWMPMTVTEVTAQTSTSTPSPTATPTLVPASIPATTRLGINYWNQTLADEIFPAGTKGQLHGYVLLQEKEIGYADFASKFDAILKAGLMPIFRIDHDSGTVPVKAEEVESWIKKFTNPETDPEPGYITKTYNKVKDAYKQGPVLYIVGNEPALDGGITKEQYATAYAALWKAVHDPDGNGIATTTDLYLLVAGPNFHAAETNTWAADVSKLIVGKQANVDGYALHTYGYGIDIDDTSLPQTVKDACKHPSQSCYGVGGWDGDNSFQNYVNQLQEIDKAGFSNKPVYITEFNTFTGATPNPHADSKFVPSGNYPDDPSYNWIGEAFDHVSQTQRVNGLLWFVGAPNDPNVVDGQETHNWRYFALSENIGRLDCARRDFRSVAWGEPRGQCDIASIAPSLGAYFFCFQGQPKIGTRISGLGLMLDKLFVTASPTELYDVSGYDPDKFHTLILDKAPPVGGYATVMLSNQAGLITQQRVYNKGCKNGSSGAGGDHPDDNQSAASGLLPAGQAFTLPAGARAVPQVAIVNRGFAGSLWQALNQLGEPSVLLDDDFDPIATIRQYPVLFIPSGGLYGVENSVVFKRRLELYAEAGGTIVAFAQQHGYEFNALPGAAGGQGSGGAGEILPSLSGYGWQEDNSCYEASLLLSANHPSLSGFSQTALIAHVDGYSWG